MVVGLQEITSHVAAVLRLHIQSNKFLAESLLGFRARWLTGIRFKLGNAAGVTRNAATSRRILAAFAWCQ
jgi:hypothetical protein